MSDAEWDSWRAKWAGAEGPLPDIRERARKNAARDRRANLIFLLLMASGFGASVNGALHGNDVPVAIALISWGIVFVGALLWVQRGKKLDAQAHPRDALAFLERRVHI